MDDRTVWGVIVLVFTLGYGVWVCARFIGDRDFELNVFDGGYLAAFAALMLCSTNGFFPIPSLLLSLAIGAAATLAGFLYANRNSLRNETGGYFSGTARALVALTAIWFIALQLWGYVWRWENYFRIDEFVVLHLAFPILAAAALLGYRWAGK